MIGWNVLEVLYNGLLDFGVIIDVDSWNVIANNQDWCINSLYWQY